VLLEIGHSVVVVDDLSTGQDMNIAHNLQNPNFRFEKVDVTDYKALSQSCKEADVIFNLASKKVPKIGNTSEVLFFNSNISRNILELGRNLDAKVIVASSSNAYGKNTEDPLKEDDNLLLSSLDIRNSSFSISKLFNEQLTFAYNEDYGLKYTILRYFGVYGPRMHPSWSAGPQSTFIESALKGDEIVVHGTGHQKRTFCYIDDIVQGSIQSLENPKAEGEIINLGSNYEVSILNFARLINHLAGNGIEQYLRFIPHEELFGKYEEVNRKFPDITKAKELLDWEPTFDLESGLYITIQWRANELEQDPESGLRSIHDGLEPSIMTVR
jgi:UDP-glucose 4-epimerase